MNRRSLLKALGIAPVAAPVVAKDAVAAALKVAMTQQASDNLGGLASVAPTGMPYTAPEMVDPDRYYSLKTLSKLLNKLRHEQERGTRQSSEYHMPLQVSVMRSWSPVFKEYVARKEEADRSALIDYLSKIVYEYEAGEIDPSAVLALVQKVFK